MTICSDFLFFQGHCLHYSFTSVIFYSVLDVKGMSGANSVFLQMDELDIIG